MAQIENEKQYEWAVARVDELLPLVGEDTPADNPNRIELELLSNMVADYSDKLYSVGKPTLPEILKLRMYEMGLNQISLSKLLGISASRVSEYLNGKSEPTLKIGREMSRKLGIDANIILGI